MNRIVEGLRNTLFRIQNPRSIVTRGVKDYLDEYEGSPPRRLNRGAIIFNRLFRPQKPISPTVRRDLDKIM